LRATILPLLAAILPDSARVLMYVPGVLPPGPLVLPDVLRVCLHVFGIGAPLAAVLPEILTILLDVSLGKRDWGDSERQAADEHQHFVHANSFGEAFRRV
jgi:hypothetical protein